MTAPDAAWGSPGGAGPLIGQANVPGGVVVAVGGAVHGGITLAAPLPPPSAYVYDFAELIRKKADGFVGREAVFAALEAFRAQNARGYFEIVGAAGLGKTALAAALVRRLGAHAFFADSRIPLTQPRQFLPHLCGSLITRYGLEYQYLPPIAREDSTFLTEVLKQAAAKAGRPVWIVVDALDEADAPTGGANPLFLPPALPDGVYVVVTRRPTEGQLRTSDNRPPGRYELLRDAPDQRQAIEEYLESRVAGDEALRRVLADARPPIVASTFRDQLATLSQNNFMYLSLVLDDIAARKPESGPFDLNTLPTGLRGYYEAFWDSMEQSGKQEGWAEWRGLYLPVLERLAVAGEAVTPEWLGAQIGRDPDEVRERALLPWLRLLSREETNGAETWHAVHRSFADFLAEKVKVPAAHRAVAEQYTGARWGQWSGWDEYGLRHAATHLAEAARQSDPALRHELTERLAALVLDDQFGQEYLARLRDPDGLERIGELALRSVAHDDAATPLRVAEVAFWLVAYRKEQRQAEPILTLALQGEVQAAERRLALFELEVDATWYRALLLVIAWLAVMRSPEAARALRDRVVKGLEGSNVSPTLALLLDRVAVALDQAPQPPVWLPEPPDPESARAFVRRLSGSAVNRSLLAGADVELLARRSEELEIEFDGYLAQQDGPELVAFAAADPGAGEPLLREYVAVHAAYGYREYRQRSLWALLDAVLNHPDQWWAQQWAAAIAVAALAPNRGEFRDGLELAVLGQKARVGEPGALEALAGRRDAALGALDSLEPPSAPGRGQGDPWGYHRRRLAALAEAFSQLPGGRLEAEALLVRAEKLPFGFAGFNAPACLTLAEAVEVAAPDPARMTRMLEAARAAAHNIQDPTFCVRTTARVNAMMLRWRGGPPGGGFDVVEAAERLCLNPSEARFAPIHVVGETYAERIPETTVRLPASTLNDGTLRGLAVAYERSLDEFARLNGALGVGPDDPLLPGTQVAVPDPGFAPLLAARFAARALADPMLSPEVRQSTIRLLVPVAADDPTMLDLVLARLVLASPPGDMALLTALQKLGAQSVAEAAPDEELQGRLTSFIP